MEAVTIHPFAAISGYPLSNDDAARFWAKATIGSEEECWLFTGSINKLGYGQFRVGGKYGVIVEAHRVAKALVDGEFNGHVLHDCDNRACCNPSHTFIGTHADNMADCAAKGRNKSPRPGNGYTKIDLAKGLVIFEKASGGRNFSELSREYGVTPTTIRNHVRKHKDKIMDSPDSMMGMAGAMIKGQRKWERKPSDFYATPYEGTNSLMPVVNTLFPNGGRIWEPCCGDMDMTRVLEWHGFEVTSSDIRDTGQGFVFDFLGGDPEAEMGWSPADDIDMMVMNPPFSMAYEFIEKALSYTPNVACLLKIDYWNAISRYQLFQEKRPLFVFPLTFRLAFLKSERGNSPLMNCMWVVWADEAHNDVGDRCIFEPMKKIVYPGYQKDGLRTALAKLGQAVGGLAAEIAR